MPEIYHLTTPLKDEDVEKLRIGDQVYITGDIYTARDSAHKRLIEALDGGRPLPADFKGQVIYYAGPSPAKPGKPIGSVGPTTSYRMDAYAPRLYDLGLKATIGKGNRNPEVIESLKKNKAVYLAAIGGAAALLARSVKASETVAYEELGPEAIRRLTVENFPAIVVNDTLGGDLYREGKKQYARS
ncbi:MAG: Fe-S-containing hydro-lyase [Chloroflexi bacterium]|nr:Fe-S-containing hydro-lyase [Chloroflexota bacterium]